MQLQKYGPQSLGAPPSWFPYPKATLSLDRKTVTYTVGDHGPADSNANLGETAAPFIPLMMPLAPGGGARNIPTLSEWGLTLPSLLTTALGRRLALRRI